MRLNVCRTLVEIIPTVDTVEAFMDGFFSDDPKPYNSYGNGAAMRVSAAGFAANSIEEAKKLSRLVTEVSHNHPEGIKGAEATVVAIFMAKTGSNIFEIRDYIDKNYYPMNFTLDEIRDTYHFNKLVRKQYHKLYRPSSSLLDLKMQI